MQLSRQITSTSLRRLEELGPHRLLAGLTDDIPAITNTLAAPRLLCTNAALVAGGLAYLGWPSVTVLLAAPGFMPPPRRPS